MHPLSDDLDYILTKIEPLAEDLRGSRLFITGGTGFFGKWLLESFVWMVNQWDLKDAHMTVLTRNPEKFLIQMPSLAFQPSLEFLKGDVRTFAFPGSPFDYVIHAATDVGANIDSTKDTIIEGTRHTLDFAKASGTRRFLLTSSGAIYGRQPTSLAQVPETYGGAPDPLSPNVAYGTSKRTAEDMCADYGRLEGFDTIIARCWAFIGPHLPLDGSYAAGNFLRNATTGKTIEVSGDGTPYRSYLYAADLVIWLWTLLLRGVSCRPYNVGSGTALTIRELAELVSVCPELSSPVNVSVARLPTSEAPQRYIPDVSRAQNELGLSVGIALDDAIARTVRWLKGQQHIS